MLNEETIVCFDILSLALMRILATAFFLLVSSIYFFFPFGFFVVLGFLFVLGFFLFLIFFGVFLSGRCWGKFIA